MKLKDKIAVAKKVYEKKRAKRVAAKAAERQKYQGPSQDEMRQKLMREQLAEAVAYNNR